MQTLQDLKNKAKKFFNDERADIVEVDCVRYGPGDSRNTSGALIPAMRNVYQRWQVTCPYKLDKEGHQVARSEGCTPHSAWINLVVDKS